MKKDLLSWGAFGAALVGTASAEYTLAVDCGFSPWVAWCVPVALDLYVVRALQVRRDVAAVVVAMIVVNAISHLVSSGLLQASVPVVVGVSAIAPLVLWRIHGLGGELEAVEVVEAVPPAVSPEPEADEEIVEAEPGVEESKELSVVDQLLMLGEPLPTRSQVMEMYGLTDWKARVALEEAKRQLEKIS